MEGKGTVELTYEEQRTIWTALELAVIDLNKRERENSRGITQAHTKFRDDAKALVKKILDMNPARKPVRCFGDMEEE